MFVWRPKLVFNIVKGNKKFEYDQHYVLYVGKASGGSQATIRDRYRNEYNQYLCQDPEELWNIGLTAGRRDRLKKYLCLWPLEFWFVEVHMPSAIRNLETRLIRMLSPPLNVQLKPRFKIGKSTAAFREET